MDKYKSTGRDTGVVAFEIGDDYIKVKFKDGSIYLYTTKSTGAAAIYNMKVLAKKGAGLTTYINQNVRERFQAKLK